MSSFTVVDTGRDAAMWMQRRRTGITATDVARLCTGGAATRSAIRAEKMGHERVFSTRATEWGKEREPIIAAHASQRFNLSRNVALLASKDDPRFLATPDLIGFTDDGEDTGGDIKTTVHDWGSWADVPRRYLPQLGWQMIVGGWSTSRLLFEPHHGFSPLYPWPKDLVLDWSILDEYGYGRDRLIEVATEFLDWDGEPDEDAAVMDSMMAEALEAKELADDADRAYKAVTAKIEDYLQGKPRQFDGSLGTLNRGSDGTSVSFDSVKYLKDHPEVDTPKYQKVTRRKGALRITPRKDA